MERKGKQDMVLLAIQAHRVLQDPLAALEWEEEVKTAFQDSRASKVTGDSQEKRGHQVHQGHKVLLGSKDEKALGSQEPLDPLVNQASQEKKATQGLQE